MIQNKEEGRASGNGESEQQVEQQNEIFKDDNKKEHNIFKDNKVIPVQGLCDSDVEYSYIYLSNSSAEEIQQAQIERNGRIAASTYLARGENLSIN